MGLSETGIYSEGCFLLPLLLPATNFCNYEVFDTKLNISGNSSKDDKKRGGKAANLFSLHSTALARAKRSRDFSGV